MEKLFSMLIPATYVLGHILERIAPGRPQPKVRFWFWKGLASFAVSGFLATMVPMLLTQAFGHHAVLDASALPMIPGALLVLLVGNAVGYWWHRARHRSTFLWRAFHQMHHSAERMDMAGAFWFHPLDTISVFTIQSLLAAFVLGVSPDAAALAGYIGFTITCLTHLNVKTPRWLGYIVARPESHSIHHSRGVHAFNYADLPIFDMIFGTFRNPETFQGQTGYYDGASSRVLAMLVGIDVSAPVRDTALEGAAE
jgi:sterol desaturase/sphingolipid hydroxylase (fatty acid hydroxylase superfamily)